MSLIVAEEAAPAQAARPEPTLVRRFLAWTQRADAAERAAAAHALARAYLHSELADDLRREALVGLTAMLDDCAASVRRALAEALAGAAHAPHHIILALANDQPEIAALVLARTPALSDAELVDCAAVGDEEARVALAGRADLSVSVAAALAEIGGQETVAALAANLEAPLTAGVLRRIVGRFGEDGQTREALLSRRWLPAAVRADLVAIAARALAPFAAAFGLSEERVGRLMSDAREQGAIAVASASAPQELRDLVAHLRAGGTLTPALLMRALLVGERAFFDAAVADLSGLALARAAAFSRDPLGSGFCALYRKTGLPAPFLAPFAAALLALNAHRGAAGERVLASVAARVVESCEGERTSGAARLLSLVRRLDAEAAIEEARAFTDEIAADALADQVAPRLAAPSAPLIWINADSPDSLAQQAPPILLALEALDAIDAAPPVELFAAEALSPTAQAA